jgi:hypothetical protein
MVAWWTKEDRAHARAGRPARRRLRALLLLPHSFELTDPSLQYPIGVKARVLAHQRPSVAISAPTACHETRRDIDLPLPVEGIEQSGSERLDIGGQIVEEVAAIAGDAAAGTFRYPARYSAMAPAGFGEPLSCAAKSGSRSCARTLSRRVHDLPSPQGTTPVKPAGHKFLMQRFESSRPSQPVWSLRVNKRCRSKQRGTAAFRRYGFVSVCGFGNGGVISGPCLAGRRPLRSVQGSIPRFGFSAGLDASRFIPTCWAMLAATHWQMPVTTSEPCKPISDAGIFSTPCGTPKLAPDRFKGS